MFEKYIQPFIVDFDWHNWRAEKLWNEKWDHVYKRYIKPLKDIYVKFSGKYATPSASRFMSLDEFYDWITQSGVIDETFGQREIGIWYNLSMMTQKDEIGIFLMILLYLDFKISMKIKIIWHILIYFLQYLINIKIFL